VHQDHGPGRIEMLDPPAIVCGEVVRGAQVGRALGFPTANLRLGSEFADLRFGVYAGRALSRPAAISIGVRPTFGEGLEPLLEAHILDFDGDLYGQPLAVELLAYLRGEARFANAEDLRHQITADVRMVREVWSGLRR
jgi:riboflavin kinase/FMN adenylyltransferase